MKRCFRSAGAPNERNPTVSDKILVIKLGALGDFVQAGGPFQAIRAHHGSAQITLLTTNPFVDFAAAAPWFDAVWIDSRPKLLQVGGWLELRARLRGGEFARVYDLQTSSRSSHYHSLWWPGVAPEWSGIARGCTFPHANPGRDFMHTIERQAEQLAMAGIEAVPAADYSWAERSDVSALDLPETYAIIAPGGAAHRSDKRWPLDRFAEIAKHLAQSGITPVIIGAGSERAMAAEILKVAPDARDVTGQTSIGQLFAMAKGARLAIGNDTGPMHVAGLSGAATLVLYSAASDPDLCAQRGPRTVILRENNMDQLSVRQITEAIARLVAPPA
ncbi:MAG: glycosyltransferase family 9 protein [Rhodospirillaceae bacterium]|nr:glycosyltransferase family 9 protein [Rhodospirillaceae bacterium]MBT6292818.1 glycosyltransferase family 9 protein [Rhodospirillaceae bacterium]